MNRTETAILLGIIMAFAVGGIVTVYVNLPQLEKATKNEPIHCCSIEPFVMIIDDTRNKPIDTNRDSTLQLNYFMIEIIDGKEVLAHDYGDRAYQLNESASHYYLEVFPLPDHLTINVKKTLDKQWNPILIGAKNNTRYGNNLIDFELNKTMIQEKHNPFNQLILPPIFSSYIFVHDKIYDMDCQQLHNYLKENISSTDLFTQLARDRILLSCLPQGNVTHG